MFDLIKSLLKTLLHIQIPITQSPKSHNTMHFIKVLMIIVTFFAYYAGIMLNIFAILLAMLKIMLA